MLKLRFPTAMAILLVACGTHQATTNAAELPNSLKLGQTELVLNGSGNRSSMMLNLYVGGLYLPTKTNDATSVINADAPMAITIKITSKFVSQKKMVAALETGFNNSTNGRTSPIAKEISRFQSFFSEPITIGDTFTIAYQPTSGVVVFKNRTRKGVIEGLAFKQALFGIWLGPNPADQALKNGLLGQ